MIVELREIDHEEMFSRLEEKERCLGILYLGLRPDVAEGDHGRG